MFGPARSSTPFSGVFSVPPQSAADARAGASRQAMPFAIVAESVNSSLAFMVTNAAGYHAEWFWQEGSNMTTHSKKKTSVLFIIIIFPFS
jgi:hypothetical protein